MDLIERVAKALFDDHWIDDPGLTVIAWEEACDLEHEAWSRSARAAISEIFDWLEKPSEAAIDSGMEHYDDAYLCRQVWRAMLAQLRKEALGDFQPSASSVETGGDDSTSVEGDGE